MKKYFLLLLAFSLSAVVYASNPATTNDPDDDFLTKKEKRALKRDCPERISSGSSFGRKLTRDVFGGSSYAGSDRWKRGGGHWSGVGIFYNGLVKNLGSLELPDQYADMKLSAGSIGFDVNPIDIVIVSKGVFGLFTGLGLEFNNFRFDNNVNLYRNDLGLVEIDQYFNQEGILLEKSKLTTAYVNIPIMAEFKFGGKNSYKRKGFVNFGVIGGIRIASHTKIKSEDSRMNGTFKNHHGLNLRDFHYGFGFNIGYSNLALSAKYYPHSIFTDKGPKVQQVNLGISLMF